MTNHQDLPQEIAPMRRLLQAVIRASISMAVIGGLAITVFAVRHSYYDFGGLIEIAQEDWALFTAIFAGLVVWNYWRIKRRGQ